MNILRFVIGESPHGLSPAKSDLFGSIIGAGAQNISDIVNFVSNNKTNSTNREIAEANNEAAIALARENNAWQGQMLEKNQGWQSEEAEKAYQRELEKMRIEMAYNTPIEQVKRLRAAGLNPALAFGGSNTASVAGASAPQASSASSGVSPSMPTLTSPHMEAFKMASPTAAMRDAAAAVAALSQADKTDVEAQQIKATLNDYVRKFKAEADFAEIGRDLELLYAGQERSLKLQSMKAEIAKSTEQALNLAKEGKFIEAKTILTRQQEKTEQQTTKLRGEQAKIAEKDNQIYFKTAFAKIDNLYSSSEFNRASASNQRSQSLFTDEQRSQLEAMRDYNLRQKAALTQMDEAELRKTAMTLDSQIDYMLGHFEALSESDKVELEKIRSELRIQKNIQNTWWFTYIFDKLERINNGLTNWIPFAPDKESSSRSEVYTDDGNGMRSRTVVHDTYRGKSFK